MLGCCGNTKRHCQNALCNSNIAAIMQQREHCGNVFQHCDNTYCGNVEAHCKQHQHCSNTSIEIGIVAMHWGFAGMPYCGKVMLRCWSIVATWFCVRSCQSFPLAPRCSEPFVFVGRGWYAGWAIGTLCGCQRSSLACLFCGCVLNYVHFIHVTFTLRIIIRLWRSVIDSIRFSRLSVCLPSFGRSSGDAAAPHQRRQVISSA